MYSLTLSDYLEMAKRLPCLWPEEQCCDASRLVPVHIEPLEDRSIFEVTLTCITKCENCGKEFVSWWD